MRNDKRFAEFIFKNGKQYKPAALPKEIAPGPLGKCFDVCAMAAASLRHYRDGKMVERYQYVEGLARDPMNLSRWLTHAWLTDGEHAFDPTWKAIRPDGEVLPILTEYVGIAIPLEKLTRFIVATEYASVVSNSWRNPELAAACIPGLPIGKISKEFFIEIHE